MVRTIIGAPPLTQERLHQLFTYDPATGILMWRDKPGGCTKSKGAVRAGYGQKDEHRQVGVDGCVYLEHRLIWFFMTGRWPDREVDHKNRVRNDNRWDNLRLATTSQNRHNSSMRAENTSGFRGAFWDKHNKKWKAVIGVDGKRKHLGMFHTAEAAGAAYAQARRGLHPFFHDGSDTPGDDE